LDQDAVSIGEARRVAHALLWRRRCHTLSNER
jgi:hypothetical protein